ncbi:hypothetical protein [Conyzicola sp.]|uniref:hypothetical protein n=1 Tax=Conyzicola sp. TaxID=1969404 RepID=UPI003988D810
MNRRSAIRPIAPRHALWISLGLVALSVLAPAAIATPTAAGAATQNAADDSSVTVKWAGGNPAELQQYQLDHAARLSDGIGADAGSGHWDDFKNLEVSVSKTRGLGDEAVVVSARGLGETTWDATQHASSNYLQVMQCWGPDPLATDFYETCQYGSRYGEEKSDVYNIGRGHRPVPVDGFAGTPFPFRAATGEVSKQAYFVSPGEAQTKYVVNGLAEFFTPSTSNEVLLMQMDRTGNGTAGFEVQSAASQPYLGCGNPATAGTRCWLVIVPFGSHSGEHAPANDREFVCTGETAYGDTVRAPRGSGISPDCTYFDDRIVIPLDFDDTTGGCPAGAAERRVVGSEFASSAFSSWQPALCATGATYNLSTNSGDLTRAQLLTGQADLAVVTTSLTDATIGLSNPALLESAELAYAPIANTALTIAFSIKAQNGTKTYTDIKLTPRLIAKLLTQHYTFDIPTADGSFADTSPSKMGRNAPIVVSEDPEWIALGNPKDIYSGYQGAFVVAGPQGDDAVGLLWQYLQSDADARAFLQGNPDPWGQTINAYYLPATNPNALGGGLPFDLATDRVDAFTKADQTLSPGADVAMRDNDGLRIDSVTYSPYASNLEAVATRIFRGDRKTTNLWVPAKSQWGPQPIPLPSNMSAILGATTAADAADYQLATASLPLPLTHLTSKDTVAKARSFTVANPETMGNAVTQLDTDPQGVAITDFKTLKGNAYPLTLTLTAAVNLTSTKLDTAARTDYSALLTYAAGSGQVSGERAGELPDGYVPLTDAQRAETAALAERILVEKTPTPDAAAPSTVPPVSSVTVPPKPSGTAGASAPVAPPVPVPVPATATQQSTTATPEMELTASTSAPGQGALGGTLLAGLIGLGAAPLLLRRRGSRA